MGLVGPSMTRPGWFPFSLGSIVVVVVSCSFSSCVCVVMRERVETEEGRRDWLFGGQRKRKKNWRI